MKWLLHLLRRGHLYLGLFLFPWAILYGVTAFLFNHPTAFSEQPTATFGHEALAGTPLEAVPSPDEQADEVLAILNRTQSPGSAYRRVGPSKYTREFAFATIKDPDRTVSVLIDVKNGSGTVRAAKTEAPKPEPERAPFAVGRGPTPGGPREGRGRGGQREEAGANAVRLELPLPDRVKDSIPAILQHTNFASSHPAKQVTVSVTSVPDLSFPVEADGRVWTAVYNATTGGVSGTPADTEAKPEFSARRFLLRLHTTHGYPGEPNARWFWAIIVDAMAIVLCFWGVTGLFMWWQIKAARIPGAITLVLSAVAATALGVAMYVAVSG